MGPNRNLVTPDEAPGPWTTNGPRVVWRVALGGDATSGPFGGLAVAEGRVLTLTTNGCEALDARSGRRLWLMRTNVGRCHGTPTVSGGRVYVYGASGVLSCLNATDGGVIWSQTISNHVPAFQPFTDHSQSPQVDGGRVMVFAGGQTNCALAFNATNGGLVWKGQNCGLRNASPMLATFAGVRQVVCQTGAGIVSLAASDGSLLWRQAGSATGYTTPLVWGESLVCPESLQAVMNVSLSNGHWSVTQVWTSSQLNTMWTLPVIKEGYAYEISSYGEFRCLNFTNGARQWGTNGFGGGSVILAGSRLVVLAENGFLHLVDPNPQEFRLLSRYQDPALTSYCLNLPAVVDGRIYYRNATACVCLDTNPPARVVGDLTCKNPTNYTLTVRTADYSMIWPDRTNGISVQTATVLRGDGQGWQSLARAPCYTNGTLVYGCLPLGTNQFFKICDTSAW